MPGKHSTRVFGSARLVLSFAAAVLVLLVVWVAVRAVGPAEATRQPSVVLPTVSKMPIAKPAAAPAPSRSVSASPSAARSSAAARTSRPVPSSARPTTEPPASSAPARDDDVVASVAVRGGRDSGYAAAVRVTNEGNRPVRWKVTVSHSGDGEPELRGVWGAEGDRDGSDLVFQGGTLDPGDSVMFGYRVDEDGRDEVRPAGCNAVGGTCTMR